MVIMYDSVLTEPPSSVHCFRDVTLYVQVFLEKDNILLCPKGTRTMYWNWIKRYGAHDFIKELLTFEEDQEGILVSRSGDIMVDVLNEFNYGDVINKIKSRSIF
jgi:hypothetical protein